LKDATFAFICPVLMIGGMLTGVFTPTEAGAAASLYGFVIVTFVYRSLTLKGLIKALSDTVHLTTKIMFVIAAAGFFSWTTNYLHISDQLLGDLLYISDNPYVILSMIVFILLILGCFLDGTAIMMITIPMFLPVVNKAGIDLIHFGVVFTLSIMIGLLTPPFGLSLFTVSTITGLSVGQTAKSVVPFMMMLFIPLMLAIFWPAFSVFIPNLLMGVH
jgi:tripartite ATP-independent transporter DctM subunit